MSNALLSLRMLVVLTKREVSTGKYQTEVLTVQTELWVRFVQKRPRSDIFLY